MTAPSRAPDNVPRDVDSWAHPVDRLHATARTTGRDTVTGRRVSGPIQGFGQMWQKTFVVRVPADEHSPEAVVAHWKAAFPTFWPNGATFYAPLAGITPGEVALFDVPPAPGSPLKMSTGILVLYADRESFTFMTPEGHALSGLITFSAYRDHDDTVVQVQALERTSDPLIELTYILGANRYNDRFWERTLENVARSLGVASPVVDVRSVCVDRRRQWRHAGNVRHSAALLMAVGTMTAPARWLRRRRATG
jgi:hypothetical protein